MKRISTIIKNGFLTLALVTGLAGGALLTPDFVSASNVDEVKSGVNAIGGNNAGNRAPALPRLIENVINILLFVIGAVAVIVIIIGGIRYTTSNGDQAQVTSAKNTILYAVVGLVVAIMAYALVNFILDALI